MSIATPVIERLAEGTLTNEEALELLQAQKQHEFATKCVAAEQPLIEKLEKDLAELQLKQQTTSDRSVTSTVNMIEVRTELELADLWVEFEEARNRITDAIEDMEEGIEEAMSTGKKDEVEKEIATIRKKYATIFYSNE